MPSGHLSSRSGPTRGRPSRGEPGYRIRDPGELVAALPSLLGFHPRASLALASMSSPSGSGPGFSDRRVGLVVRCDLPEPVPDRGRAEAALARLGVDAVLRDDPSGVAIIVIDDRGSGELHWDGLVERVSELLEARGIEVAAAMWAAGSSGGSRWACLTPCGCSGTVPEQESIALAAGAAVAGTVVYPDRSALLELVTPTDPAAIRRRERLLVGLVDAAAGDRSAARGVDSGLIDPAAATARLEEAMSSAAAGRLHLDDRTVVALAVALTIPAVRNTAIGAIVAYGASGSAAAGGEQLWAALARETPDPEAAEPASLLAVAALLRGDGALANVAIDRAQQAWPGHLLSRMLRTVADWGMRPDEFRTALTYESEALP